MFDSQIEIEVKLKSTPTKTGNGKTNPNDKKLDREVERELYNTELEWMKARPPSEEQLVG